MMSPKWLACSLRRSGLAVWDLFRKWLDCSVGTSLVLSVCALLSMEPVMRMITMILIVKKCLRAKKKRLYHRKTDSLGCSIERSMQSQVRRAREVKNDSSQLPFRTFSFETGKRKNNFVLSILTSLEKCEMTLFFSTEPLLAKDCVQAEIDFKTIHTRCKIPFCCRFMKSESPSLKRRRCFALS